MILELNELDNPGAVARALGKRPNKRVEADYLRRTGFMNKWMFYDSTLGKHVRVRSGDRFEVIHGQPPRLVQ